VVEERDGLQITRDQAYFDREFGTNVLDRSGYEGCLVFVWMENQGSRAAGEQSQLTRDSVRNRDARAKAQLPNAFRTALKPSILLEDISAGKENSPARDYLTGLFCV
jgi:hypothetical protein